MRQTLLTSEQRRKLASNNRKVQQIRELIGTTIEVGPGETSHNGEKAELIGWRFNSKAEIEYVIRYYSNDQCILITEEDFQKKGYVFIG